MGVNLDFLMSHHQSLGEYSPVSLKRMDWGPDIHWGERGINWTIQKPKPPPLQKKCFFQKIEFFKTEYVSLSVPYYVQMPKPPSDVWTEGQTFIRQSLDIPQTISKTQTPWLCYATELRSLKRRNSRNQKKNKKNKKKRNLLKWV